MSFKHWGARGLDKGEQRHSWLQRKALPLLSRGTLFSQAPMRGPWVTRDGKNLSLCPDLRRLPWPDTC